MTHIKITCWQCQQESILQVPDACFPCTHKEILKELNKKPPKNFWRGAKSYAYHMLLYMPPCLILFLKFGFWYEMAWIGGTIYISLIPIIREWLMSKF